MTNILTKNIYFIHKYTLTFSDNFPNIGVPYAESLEINRNILKIFSLSERANYKLITIVRSIFSMKMHRTCGITGFILPTRARAIRASKFQIARSKITRAPTARAQISNRALQTEGCAPLKSLICLRMLNGCIYINQ